ncbi:MULTISPECIES: ABC transporter substrate-binding protein [unclassified Streptomyces]|uniref:ABC transporter substrate-binding protein n=1 Tax=unclassified Streptomyces TaxID=2593676 RepID=UPI00166164FA|nr:MULTISPECIES: ABC transporter substrate-binding protein [unclassified Streptomyces]MBD0709696.1 ABC transporter substrate-binding protein [Streptomyces sp. CBMA291]MBD0714541.1 ABC transporter substrate-binding protein [Streptomyces sp. CBMA370]
MPVRPRATAAALAATASVALLASACTGSANDTAADDPKAKTTLTFWHGWVDPAEVKAINANIARFEKAHPNIKVKAVGGINDDKLGQALRAGGSKGPDVVSSFTTSNVGKFCASGALADLKPFIEKDGLDLDKIFPKVLQEYTQFEGKRCSMPLLSDAYGLYYNKDAFRKAGLDPEAPPKTWSQFTEVAKRLTKPKGDSYEQLGFMPTYLGYETVVEHYMPQWKHQGFFDAQGKSTVGTDPAFAEMMTYQKSLVNALGGFQKLDKYRTTFGDEWGPTHPFHTGQVAMQLDGEWRLNFTKKAKVPFEVGVAPLPVADADVADYGKGFLSGTIMGIAPQSKKQNAAWELIKFMTTDTDAVVGFANDIGNVPSTLDALNSPDLAFDKRFKVFLDIARHPRSDTSDNAVNGSSYQETIQRFSQQYEKGQVTDLKEGLADTAAQIDRDIAAAK